MGEIFDRMDTIGWGEAKHYMGVGDWAQHFFVRPKGAAILRYYAERSRARSLQINACTGGLLDWLYEHDGEDCPPRTSRRTRERISSVGLTTW